MGLHDRLGDAPHLVTGDDLLELLQVRADASDQLLTEARELRSKQDARLATIQRQSQLVVAGFLAIAAIVVAAASAVQPGCATPCQTDQPPYIIPLIAIHIR